MRNKTNKRSAFTTAAVILKTMQDFEGTAYKVTIAAGLPDGARSSCMKFLEECERVGAVEITGCSATGAPIYKLKRAE